MKTKETDRIYLLKKAHEGIKKLKSMSEEDYIEVVYEVEKKYGIAKLTDISRILGVKPPTALSMIRKLEKKGMIEYMKYRGIKLTEKGRTLAQRISKNHEFIRKLLIDIGVEEERANIEAELMEHILSKQTIEKLKKIYNECVAKPTNNSSKK